MKTKIQDLDDQTYNEITSKLKTGDTEEALDNDRSNISPNNTTVSKVCERIPEPTINDNKQRTDAGNEEKELKRDNYIVNSSNHRTETDTTISRINDQVMEYNFLEIDNHPVKRRIRTVKFNPRTKIFKCTNRYCHLSFTSFDELSNHLKSCKKSLADSQTDYTGTSSDCNSLKSETTYGYSNNETEGSKVDSYQSKERDKQFLSVPNKVPHAKPVTLPSCIVCGIYFSSKYELDQHNQQKHENSNWIKCEFCDSKFYSIAQLNDHITMHTVANSSSYRCESCKMQFLSVTELESHVAHHDKNVVNGGPQNENITCPLCRKVFFVKKEFDEHILTHIGVYPYKCEICDAGFNREEHLRVHATSVHRSVQSNHKDIKHRVNEASKSEEKLLKCYTCQLCGETFSKSRSYKKHVRLHKKYKRSKHVRYKHFRDWREHQQRHLPDLISSSDGSESGDSFGDTYACKSRSKRKSSVAKISSKTEIPFDCPFCKQSFKKYKYLKSHLLSHAISTGPNATPLQKRNLEENNASTKTENTGSETRLNVVIEQPVCGSCVACGINFTDFNDLELHLSTFHSNRKEKVFNNYSNTDNQSYKQQPKVIPVDINGKNSTTDYECDICDMKFTTDNLLNEHISSHFKNKHVAIDVSNEINKRMTKNLLEDFPNGNANSRGLTLLEKSKSKNEVSLKRSNQDYFDPCSPKYVKSEQNLLRENDIEISSGGKKVGMDTTPGEHVHGEHSEIDSVCSPRESVAFSPRVKFMSDTDSGFSEKTNVVSDVESVYSPTSIDVNSVHTDKLSSRYVTNMHPSPYHVHEEIKFLNIRNNETYNITPVSDMESQPTTGTVYPLHVIKQSRQPQDQNNLVCNDHKQQVPLFLSGREKPKEDRKTHGINFHLMGRLK